MVSHPGDYRWSSDRAHVEGITDGIVDFDPWYEGLGVNGEGGGRKYRAWVQEAIPEGKWHAIRGAIRWGGLNGGDRFRGQISKLIGRALEIRPPGRPRKVDK